jgi:hypothetical protein
VELLTDELIECIASADEDEQERWLILEPSSEFKACWDISSLGVSYQFDLEDELGRYRCVPASKLAQFVDAAKERSYRVAIDSPPGSETLQQEPLRYPLESGLAGTTGGLLPFQLEGFNKLKGLDGGVALWSTGAGKAVFMSAVVNHYWHENAFDLALLIPKGHNKVNTQRKLKQFTGIEALVLPDEAKRRNKIYETLNDGSPKVVVTNYEKLRVDFDAWWDLLGGRRVLIVWDEAPVKLSNRRSQLYEAIRALLYGKQSGVRRERLRPSWLKQFITTATPVERNPEGWFNCIRLIDPTIFGTVDAWQKGVRQELLILQPVGTR